MQLRKDISRLERVVTGQLRRAEISEPLERKYNIPEKDHQIVLEEIKQRVTTQAAKLRRHKKRTTQHLLDKSDCLNAIKKDCLRN